MIPSDQIIPVEERTKPTCYHCGDRCDDHSIELDAKYFCCNGCQLVYSILNENDLCRYYDLNEAAGISQRGRPRKEYAFLDDADTVRRLISFSDGKQCHATFYIPQIHCSSCLWLLENIHILNAHVLESRVDFLNKEVKIIFDQEEQSLRQIVEQLADLGYAPHIQLNDLDGDERPIVNKSLYYKLGLAGFAFGNIMLLSFPEYLGLASATDHTLNRYFSYFMVLLILPVVFYSGWGYLHSAWQGLKQRHLNIDVPVSLGILALFFRSLYEIFILQGAGYLDSLAGLIFFLLIGKWFQQSTYARIAFDRDFKSYFPIACTVIESGQENQITLDKLNVGDRVIIRHGELIPADAVLIKGRAKIDYSFVTGESAPITKKAGDVLYAGGRQTAGIIEITVTKKVSNSYLTQLWNDHAFIKEKQKGRVNEIADRVATFFTWAILIIGAATLLYWLPRDVSIAINAFTAVLIIACPCAVALSIPFTFGNVIRLFARANIYFKNIHVIEALAKIKKVVFDKTGTLTYVQGQALEYEGGPLSPNEKIWIYSLVRHSNHPISRQIANALRVSTPLPVRQFMEKKGLGVQGAVDGHKIRIGSAQFIDGQQATHKHVLIEIDGRTKGVFIQHNQYRKGMHNVLQSLRQNASLFLLSGDNAREKNNLIPLFQDADHMLFDQKPEQKLHFIKSLQERNEGVAMVGDGLNDAGALSQSQVGIVITENTSNFTPACDIIMDARQFSKLPVLFSFAKTSIRLVYAAYAIALVYNIIGLSFAVQGALSPVIAAILMPASSVTIVLFGVGASTWLAHRQKIW